ncbi:proline-rich protein 35 [Ornithorhynchus anatinus]|uniref:Proline rich 35 n=1 Tax=Ornithorhynchus anatinus TaxID=9258 RepID=A0A6I8PKF2_ORNAN|nr:proline-rich protein 35 [Ornithorhynchus anatinus]
MSKDDGSCRLSSVFKPKERKPKKPHYIPRPWGKPYNYKCFQCPFTCMEKSHLYNHMKYSLCKNSLSLLIDNDWSYRKGTTLTPDLRLLPARGRRGGEAGEVEGDVGGGPAKSGAAGTGGSAGAGAFLQGGPGEGPSQRKAEGGGRSGALLLGLEPEREPPPEFLIADVVSLKNPGGVGPESVALMGDARVPLPGRVSKGSSGGRGPPVEQWKRAVPGPRRGAQDISPQNSDRPIIPCYPPPAYSDYHEPQGHSLSVLGINYPLNHPGLFSYLGPSVVGGAVAHPHVAQLPFLASPAPTPFQAQPGPDRPAFLPRFYYPLLFEQALGAPARKPETPTMTTATLPAKGPFALPKAGFLKVPTPKEGSLWPRSLREVPQQASGEEGEDVEEEDMGRRLGPEKGDPTGSGLNGKLPRETGDGLPADRDGTTLLAGDPKPEAAPGPETPSIPGGFLKRKLSSGTGPSFSRNLPPSELPSIGKSSPHHSIQAGPVRLPKPPRPWASDVPCCQPPSDEDPGVLGVLPPGGSTMDQPAGTTALLSGELSRTLGAYQTVEKKLSDLADEDGPAQKPLREQLVEIQRELLRIHQALERATRPPEGPLDLSLKKEPPAGEEQATGKLGGAGPRGRGPGAGGWEREKILELLPQTGRAEGVSASPEPPAGAPAFPLEIRQAVGPLCGHTTKCEADSSVLLCADGRAGPPVPPLSMREEGSPGCRGVLCCGPGSGGSMGLPDP